MKYRLIIFFLILFFCFSSCGKSENKKSVSDDTSENKNDGIERTFKVTVNASSN